MNNVRQNREMSCRTVCKSLRKYLKKAVVCGFLGVCGAAVSGIFGIACVSAVNAADYSWTGGAGNWSAWTQWVNGAGNNANINNGPLTLDTTVTARNITLNNNSVLNIQNNVTARFLSLAASATPTVNISAGNVDLTFCHVTQGTSFTACPTLNITGGTVTMNAKKESRTDSFVLGYNTGLYGKLTMSGGTLTIAAETSFSLGLNANAAGLAEISGGTVDVKKDLNIGDNGIGTVTMSETAADTNLSAVNLYIGKNTGARGTLTVSGGTLKSISTLSVGEHGTGTLTVSGSGTVGAASGTSSIVVGKNAGSSGTLEIQGGTVTAPNVYLSEAGTGKLTMSGGTLNANLFVGNNAVSAGSVISGGTVNGIVTVGNNAAGTLTVSGNTSFETLRIGNNAVGTLNLTGGTLTLKTNNSVFGIKGNAAVNISGGTLDATGKNLTFSPGESTAGRKNTLTLSGTGSIKSADLILSDLAGCGTEFTMAGGSVTCTGKFMLGRNGDGTAEQSGGSVSVGNLFVLGSFGGASGTYTVSGTGTLSSATYYVGNFGTGTLNLKDITSAETVKNVSGTNFYAGYEGGGFGTVNMADGVMEFTNVYLGFGGLSGKGEARGLLNLSGGNVTAGNTVLGTNFQAAQNVIASGELNISGGTYTSNHLNLAAAAKSSGKLTLSGTGTLTVTADATLGNLGSANVLISGGKMTAGEIVFASASGSRADAVISGGELKSSGNIVFASASGSHADVTLSDTGKITAVKEVLFSQTSGSSSDITMTGGTISGTNLILGPNGTGTFKMSGGLISVTTEFIIGRNDDSNFDAEISGGTVNSCQMILGSGQNGAGTLLLSGGTVNLAGKNIYVGNNSHGTLTLSGKGTLTADALVLRNHPGANSTLNVRGGGSSVTLGALKNTDTSANSAGAVNFTVTETGISTLSVGTLNLAADTPLSIDAAISGFLVHDGTSFTLIDVTGSIASAPAFVSKNAMFNAPAVTNGDVIVTLNSANQAMVGESGFFQISTLTGGSDASQLFITTNLTGTEDLTAFAQWLTDETGVETDVEDGGVYIWKNMKAAENFLWDFRAYTNAGMEVALTRVGVDSNFATTPEPASWVLTLLGIFGMIAVRRKMKK